MQSIRKVTVAIEWLLSGYWVAIVILRTDAGRTISTFFVYYCIYVGVLDCVCICVSGHSYICVSCIRVFVYPCVCALRYFGMCVFVYLNSCVTMWWRICELVFSQTGLFVWLTICISAVVWLNIWCTTFKQDFATASSRFVTDNRNQSSGRES